MDNFDEAIGMQCSKKDFDEIDSTQQLKKGNNLNAEK